MKKGLLVYDKADAEYNRWFIEHIIEVGKEMGMDISLMLTEDIVGEFGGKLGDECIPDNEFVKNSVSRFEEKYKPYDFAIMRNRNPEMSVFFEKIGIRCFNSSYVCKIGNDKWEMYQDFVAAGIPVMYTQKTKLPYPFVMKPRSGHGGENVYLINNKDEYLRAIESITKKDNRPDAKYEEDDLIYQMVASEKGRDIRVYVVGDVILTAMERRATSAENEASNEFRANYSLGGSATEYALTEDELKFVAKVQKHINADFVGIDIIYNNGKPVVNEIEDAVGTRMLYANTNIDAIREYLTWIEKVV